MANPVKPQAKRSKPTPAIFADPTAEQVPFVSGPATFPATATAAASAAMVDHDAVAAAIDLPAVPGAAARGDATVDAAPAADAVPTPNDAPVTDAQPVADAAPVAADAPTEAPDLSEPERAAAAMVDAGQDLAERTVETVTAHLDPVSVPSKGLRTMATAYDTTKAQDMMGDISAKAKGQMEKGVKFAEDMTEFTKGNVQAIVESTRIAAKGMESLAHDAAETAKSGFEQAQTAMKSFTQVKSPTELFQLQSDYAKTAFDQLVANASKASEQMMKFMGDVAQPLSNRYALASEKVKSAAF